MGGQLEGLKKYPDEVEKLKTELETKTEKLIQNDQDIKRLEGEKKALQDLLNEQGEKLTKQLQTELDKNKELEAKGKLDARAAADLKKSDERLSQAINDLEKEKTKLKANELEDEKQKKRH